MDARSVMEQRLQSMVCCVSMVQRVLDHQQPQPQAQQLLQSQSQQSQEQSSLGSSSSSSAGPAPCPAHTVPIAEAAEKVRQVLHTTL